MFIILKLMLSDRENQCGHSSSGRDLEKKRRDQVSTIANVVVSPEKLSGTLLYIVAPSIIHM